MRAGTGKRQWIVITVAAVALSACAGVETTAGGATGTMPEGNVALFCRAWPDAQRTVVDVLEGEDQRLFDDRSAAIVDETMAGYDRAAPPEIRADWNRLYDAYTKASDLTHTVGYAGHGIRAEHVEMMFGPGGIEKAMTDALSAIEAIDEWSVTACGDFCSRWPELRDAVLFEGFNGDWYPVMQRIDRDEVAVRAGFLLVPDGLASPWETAATIKLGFLTMFREEGLQSDFPEEWDTEEVFIERVGLSQDVAVDSSTNAVEAMDTWVEANCDATAVTGGAPGTLSVRIRPRDDLVGRTILLALLPVGTDFQSVTGPSEYLGALCPEAHEAPEIVDRELAIQAHDSGRTEEELIEEWWDPQPLRPMLDVGEYHEGSICNLVVHGYEGLGPGELVLPGGSYELFAGAFVGSPGSYDLYFAAPQRCAQVTVKVDGDTVVDIPSLDACDLEPIGSPEEIARRPSTPPTGDSRLWIEIPNAIQPEGSVGHFTAVLVPAGTTLGEIGRGTDWPTGGVAFGYGWLPDDEEDLRSVRRAEESGLVPILPYGPGGGVTSIGPVIDWEWPWDALFPKPAALEAGTYDLRIYAEDESEGCHDDQCRREFCGSVVVEVDGDTVVPLPEWGECP